MNPPTGINEDLRSHNSQQCEKTRQSPLMQLRDWLLPASAGQWPSGAPRKSLTNAHDPQTPWNIKTRATEAGACPGTPRSEKTKGRLFYQ